MSQLFNKPAPNDMRISGLEGSRIHVHETPFGCGVVTDQSVANGQGRHIETFNRFNAEVNALLKPFPLFPKK